MKKPLILLNSAPDRAELRKKFLQNYNNLKHSDNYELRVVIERDSIHLLRQKEIIKDNFERIIIIVDDDMIFTSETDFFNSVELAKEQKVGMVSNGWKFSLSTKRGVKDEFVKRKLVFTGGGLVLSIPAQKVISLMPKERYWSDNVAWSIECTKAGLQNYYYRGSIAVHKVCQNGGRKTLLQETDFIHHPSIKINIGKSGQILIPTEKYINWE